MPWLALVLLPAVVAVWARTRLRVVEVRGQSMQPTYVHGDRLLVHRGSARAGHPVVFRRPERLGTDVDWLIKRAVATAGQPVPPPFDDTVADTVVPAGHLLVRGDNPHSIDSRHFGYIAEADVLGTPIRRLSLGTEASRRAIR